MREHKYRAWDTVKKVMYSANELGADQETLSVDGRGFVNVSSTSTRLSQFHAHLLPLEYTGLKDKNGIEGYHADIAEGYGDWVIEWNEIEGCFYLKSLVGYDKLPIRKLKEMNIIGNIYENHELLEAK